MTAAALQGLAKVCAAMAQAGVRAGRPSLLLNQVRRQTTGGGNSESGNNGKSAEEGDHDDAAVGTGFDSGFRDGYQAGFEEGRRRIETTPGAPKA
ncbi:hypothetical protein IWW50_003559 [Coemansia erecta]|nr:hypothetical protein IWW50_003559 [Coemansia erecta]